MKESSNIFNRNFVLLCFLAVFSNFAFSSYLLFEQWFVIDQLKKPEFVGYILASTALPRALMMVFGGAFSDRFSNQLMIRISLGFRVILILASLVALKLNKLDLPLLFFFAISIGVLDSIFQPAMNSIMPKLLPESLIEKGNGYFMSLVQVSLLAGPALSGFAIEYFGFDFLLIYICTALGLALGMAFFIKSAKLKEAVSPNTGIKEKLKEGFLVVSKSIELKRIVLFIACINVFYFGPVVVGIPILIKIKFNSGADFVGFTQGAYAAGMILGSLVVPHLSLNLNSKNLIKFSFLLGGMLALISFQNIKPLLVANVFALGVLSSSMNVTLISKIQRDVSDKLVGTVIGFVVSLSSGLVPVSYAAAGMILGAGISPSLMYVISGMCIFLFYPCLVLFGRNKVNKEPQVCEVE